MTLDLFAGGIHAKANHLPGSEKAKKMTAGSGLKCYELLKLSGRGGLLPKMFLATPVWGSMLCYLNWKPKGTNGGRLLFQLVPSMPDTNEIACGLLPTMVATEYGTNKSKSSGASVRPSLQTMARQNLWPTMRANLSGHITPNRVNDKNNNLEKAVAQVMWPTPHANCFTGAHHSAQKEGGFNLQTAVKLWPTASSRDWKDSPGMKLTAINQDGTTRKRTDQLARAVYSAEQGNPEMFPTPTALGEKGGGRLDEWGGAHNRFRGTKQGSGPLSPYWVEWLMGYPIGWTDLKD